ncbi:MAG: hypothetical protein CM1200mP16_03560 [Nitrospina sp.]|nr:MAG: hypothetical protein CM1200mP16_03560 [Nitrospina sp.]
MTEILQLDDKADTEARRIMGTYKNAPREGSPEWDIMYQKHFDEFTNKQGYELPFPLFPIHNLENIYLSVYIFDYLFPSNL